MKELIEFAKNYLNKYKNLLADEFQHFFFGSVYDSEDKFPVYCVFIDEDGRVFETIGPDKPGKVMSVLYPTYYNDSEILVKKYTELSRKYNKIVQPNVTFGIVQSPFKITSYRVWGNERLIKKLIFSEKLKGEEYISLNQNITEEKLKFIIEHYKQWDNDIFYFPYLNDIHVLFKVPEHINGSEVSIYIEIGRILKEKVLRQYDFLKNSYKLPEMKIKAPSLAVFKVPADRILDIDFKSIHDQFIKKAAKIVDQINELEIEL
ncbi:DUF4895 domain-containing protein [Petrotoga olearia]|uniref:DUF4895 domain-containing protein n=2 Tax=Petrotoga olearia TaxID=156203 RepID=A0A2K1P5T2_9BACT|nr:DUF4895 domain-containing protein [Petrotoga olearia]KUK15282.1 MAG: Uncharacterized protein XD53_1296 [Petrotoga mobilis]PNR98141.1 hypothetical protein X929_01720 [Petrotoga olearia DSM 13574]RMA75694.1 uncharacterized protein DUF4895 [Petrotoga olearia]HBT51007.1 DUF4895 domain-containing protein [Petrotoga sp.]